MLKSLEMKKAESDEEKKSKFNIKKDFKEFFIEETGSSIIKEAEFQSVSPSESSESSDDFKEQDQEVQQKGIKTFQFWNGIKFPKDAPKPADIPVQWQISCPYSFGYNSLGKDNIIYIDGLICKSVGCLLVFNKQIYSKHNKKITTLSFNVQKSELLSASESSNPQFFLWNYDLKSKNLQFIRRFSIGSKSEDIYSISFFYENYVVAVQIFTLHKSSILHCFTKNDGKKVSSLKVGKFYDLELANFGQTNHEDLRGSQDHQTNNNRLYFANDEGISELICEKSEDQKPVFRADRIHESDNVCCLLPFYDKEDLEIIYGDKEGNLNLVFNKQLLQVHEGWIFELKSHQHKNKIYFFALGAMDFKLSVIEYSDKKIKVIRKLQLGGYGRSIESQNDLLLIGKRDGDYEEFSLGQLIEQKNDSKIIRKETPSLKCFETKEKRKQFFFEVDLGQSIPKKSEMQVIKNIDHPTKSFIYGHSRSKSITFFTIENQNLKDVSNYPLRYYPQALDFKQNILAYIYFVEKDQNGQTSTEFSKTSKFKQKTIKKLVLVIEDIENKNALLKFPLETDIEKKNDQISVQVNFSPSGNILAVSDPSGNLYIMITNNKESLSQELIQSDKKTHKEAIRQIVWSKDQKWIKTVSETELYYWEVSGEKENQVKLLSVKAGQIVDVIWNQMSKFGWQTKNVWESTDLVGDIYKFWSQEHTKIDVVEKKSSEEVSAEKQNFIGCVKNDGFLRLYNYPAKASKRQEIRIHSEAFQVFPYFSTNNKFSFLVLIQGIILMMEIVK